MEHGARIYRSPGPGFSDSDNGIVLASNKSKRASNH